MNKTSAACKPPIVSIGLAVFNGERYLQQAIESILAQTFTDFELIISDNASTDRTETIARYFADRDCRIRYSRNETNIGGANNENQTFKMSRGKYFRWAGHDDMIAPTFLERCVDKLESDPSMVLCHTGVVLIDANGNEIGRDLRFYGTSSDPSVRFGKIALSRHSLDEIYGLIRSNVFARTRLEQNYSGSDRTLLAELALYGSFGVIEEPLFFRRLHDKNIWIDTRTRQAWFNPSYAGLSLPSWRQLGDWVPTIRRSGMPLSIQLKCSLIIAGPWMATRARHLAKDLVVAAYMGAMSQRARRQRYASTNNWT